MRSFEATDGSDDGVAGGVCPVVRSGVSKASSRSRGGPMTDKAIDKI